MEQTPEQILGKTAPPLPEPDGDVVRVSTVEQLQAAVSDLVDGRTVLIEPGEYRLERTLIIDKVRHVSLRGATGDRSDVVLRGRGMREEKYGEVPHVISVFDADDLLVADLSLADAWWHDMHLAGRSGPQRTHLYNLHFLDSGEQLLKVNPGRDPIAYPDDGLIEYCRFEFTDRGKHWYHDGVDLFSASGWTIRDCEFVRIRGPVGEMCGPAVLCFSGTQDTVVERNLFLECDVGIGLGIFHLDPDRTRDPERKYAHRRGIVRNNVILRTGSGGSAGILVGYSSDYRIYHNTIVLNGTSSHTILYGDRISCGEIKYNLADGPFQAADDLCSLDPWSLKWEGRSPEYHPADLQPPPAVIEGNLTRISPDWFADFAKGDLHLTERASEVIDQAVPLEEVRGDFDGRVRPVGPLADIGAFEYPDRIRDR